MAFFIMIKNPKIQVLKKIVNCNDLNPTYGPQMRIGGKPKTPHYPP